MTTKIEWTAVQGPDGQWHRGFTFNPWWGCIEASPACAHCYARTWDRRTGGAHWGAAAPRRFFGEAHWARPLTWARKAERLGVRLRVFCASMSDWLEDRADLKPWRERLFEVIEATPQLDWLMLTKRPARLRDLTPWGGHAPANVWLGTTAESQRWADERLPALNAVEASIYFVSAEPLLGPVTLRRHRVDWVICGGESGPKARETRPEWVAALRDECADLGRAFFLKQLQDPTSSRGRVISLPVFEGRQHRGQPQQGGGA